MPRLVVAPQPWRPARARRPLHAVVIGGGVAGCAAATVLAQRGARVTLREAAKTLGGRTGAWPVTLDDGSVVVMGHGFHAFFRQYYNLRALLRRAGVRLVPLEDYTILSPRWPPESFRALPRRSPWSLLALVARSPSIGWRDLVRMDGRAAAFLLSYDGDRTYAELDRRSAADLLDSLRLPPRARNMLFDVFSHSFFNREEEMSAAELVQMFHFYFLGNPEGLLFDVPDGDHLTALWDPWRRYLERLGVSIEVGTAVRDLSQMAQGWLVDGESADAVVVACDVPGVKALAAGTPLEPVVSSLPVAPPYAVLRLWTDRDCAPSRPPFAGVSNARVLDSVSLYHRLEEGSAAWARRRGGGVYELHAYGLPHESDPEEVARLLVEDLATLFPETAGMGICDRRWRWAADCAGFPVGSHAAWPGVDVGMPRLYLAGDYVKLPFPSALMERAAASGVLAANAILDLEGVRCEPVWSVRPRGLLARVSPARPGVP